MNNKKKKSAEKKLVSAHFLIDFLIYRVWCKRIGFADVMRVNSTAQESEQDRNKNDRETQRKRECVSVCERKSYLNVLKAVVFLCDIYARRTIKCYTEKVRARARKGGGGGRSAKDLLRWKWKRLKVTGFLSRCVRRRTKKTATKRGGQGVCLLSLSFILLKISQRCLVLCAVPI